MDADANRANAERRPHVLAGTWLISDRKTRSLTDEEAVTLLERIKRQGVALEILDEEFLIAHDPTGALSERDGRFEGERRLAIIGDYAAPLRRAILLSRQNI